MSWASSLKDLSLDHSARYNLLVVSGYYAGPDYELGNISADTLIDHLIDQDIPEEWVVISDYNTGKLTGLKLATGEGFGS